MKNRIFFPLLFVFIFWSCQSLSSVVQEPKVSLNSVDIAGISLTGVSLIVRVDVDNPNAFSIPLPKIDWELFVNTAPFIKGSLPSNNTIKSRGKVTVDIPVSITYEGLFQSFSSLVQTKEAAYKIALDITFPIPIIGDKVYHLDFSGVIPILQMPGISFQGITSRTAGTILNPTLECVVTWEVENKNNFAFKIGEFSYDFLVNKNRWAQGRINNPPQVKANGKTPVSLTVSINAGSMLTELLGIISRGSSVDFSCTGNMSLAGELSGLDKLELPLNLAGSTRIR